MILKCSTGAAIGLCIASCCLIIVTCTLKLQSNQLEPLLVAALATSYTTTGLTLLIDVSLAVFAGSLCRLQQPARAKIPTILLDSLDFRRPYSRNFSRFSILFPRWIIRKRIGLILPQYPKAAHRAERPNLVVRLTLGVVFPARLGSCMFSINHWGESQLCWVVDNFSSLIIIPPRTRPVANYSSDST